MFAGLLLCIQAQSISLEKDEVSISVEYADNSLSLAFSHSKYYFHFKTCLRLIFYLKSNIKF